MSLHKEISFETEVCQYLGDHGWLYADGDAAAYDRARALFPVDVLAWVQSNPRLGKPLPRTTAPTLETPCWPGCATNLTSAARWMYCDTALNCWA